jgi:tRNA-dihydrouridine synthase B
MAQAARLNADQGAQIIDINMGCPAKKVCNHMAGSALLKDESLVARILDAVVAVVKQPVTLKIRTGWDHEHRNGPRIARIAESCGVQALAVHGRTRADAFRGAAEYDTIGRIKQSVTVPVIANGDIRCAEQARFVLQYTGADGLMIGRAAQGRPWIFRELAHYLETGETLAPPPPEEIRDILLKHLRSLYRFYGEYTGVRIARKHISWYCKDRPGSAVFRHTVNQLETTQEQLDMVKRFFSGSITDDKIAA